MPDSTRDLGLTSPWMNASGFMGYLPQRLENLPFPPGAFVTNPISLVGRDPAHNRGVIAYPGGFLLHTGHPNPGLKKVLRTYADKWRRLPLSVWLHLLVSTPYECEQMVREVEGIENVTALEIRLLPGMGVKKQLEIISSAAGELPVFLNLPMDEVNLTLIDRLPEIGGIGLVLSAPRGMIQQAGKMVQGRLFGPSLHPQMLTALHRLRGVDLPVVAGAGIFSLEQGEAALSAGASAVQVDGWCWKF